jgi:myo-inositol-1-phosphate synthase
MLRGVGARINPLVLKLDACPFPLRLPMSVDSSPPRLGIFTVGLGAVATTLIAGVELIRRGARQPVGSYTQLGWLEGKDGVSRRVSDALDLPALSSLVFGAVDLIETNALDAAKTGSVLSREDLATVGDFLATVTAGAGIHDPTYVRTLDALRKRPEAGKHAQALAMRREFEEFVRQSRCERAVVLLTLSTEAWRPLAAAHATPEAFVAGLQRNDPEISPSQIYAWAAIEAGLPVVNCTPNVVLEVPAIQTLAASRGVPLAGSDLKSGQTLMKTVIAAALGKRLLGVRGWYSTNILGNRDGLVLDAPENFRAKEITKGGVLSDLLDAEKYPGLYGQLEHQVHINYFPPKGDDKEAWDAVQLFGWLGYPMELKINFQCRDSILAAPLVLDLALLADFAARRKASGIQSWLGAYFKSPAIADGETTCNDFHRQLAVMEEKLRHWA